MSNIINATNTFIKYIYVLKNKETKTEANRIQKFKSIQRSREKIQTICRNRN